MTTARTAIAAAAALGTLLVPAAADAAVHGAHQPSATHGHAAQPKHVQAKHVQPKHVTKPKKAKPVTAAAVHVEGLVLRHAGASVTVQVRQGTVGRADVAHRVMTFALPRGSKVTPAAPASAAGIVDGSTITITGSATGKGGAVARTATVTPTPASALVGVALSTRGASLVVTGTGAEDGNGDEALEGAAYVDTSRAAVTLDGVVAPLSQVAPGAYVVVLGERDGDVVVATSVIAYSAAPAAALGTVASVDGSTVTLASDDQGDGGTTGTAVDDSAATVVRNGVAATGDQLNAGDHVLALGATDAAGVLQAQVVLAFDGEDQGPAPFSSEGHGDE